jgi:hypothetical protein
MSNLNLTLEPRSVRIAIIAIETLLDHYKKQSTVIAGMSVDALNFAWAEIMSQLPKDFKIP